MGKSDKRKNILFGIFILIFILRLIKVDNPPLDYSSWRQVDTDSIARNFVEYKFNILYPQLNYDGPMPNYVQLELQVTTFIIALIYSIAGYNIIFGRLIPITFFMGSCFFLYYLVRRRSGVNTAMLTVFIYGILPLNLIYSRNVMPESSMMFFMIGGLYYFDLWLESNKLGHYILSLVFTSLTVFTKLPSALIGIPMIYMAVYKLGRKAFKNIYLYIFPIFTLGLPFIYFRWLGSISEQRFVQGIGINVILPNFLHSIFRAETAKYLTEQFADKLFTIPGAILFSIGLVIKKRKEEYLYYVWMAAGIFHIIFVDTVIHLDYYLMFITPVISVFMGCASAAVIYNKKYDYFIYTALIIILLQDAVFMKDAYKLQYKYIEMGNNVLKVSSEDDLIIIGKDSPELLYTSNRKGWRLYGDMLTVENIKRLASQGAKFFVPASDNIDGDLKSFLDANYTKICFPDGYCIYRLIR